jgi:hypothetical protein
VNILEILTAGQGGTVVGNLARSFGLDRKQAAAVLEAVVPELTRAMERQSFNRGGIADMVETLGRADYEKVLEPDARLDAPEIQASGIDVLDTVLWSKDRSRGVAHRAARTSGVDEALIRQMLPAIGAVLMGGLASKAGGALDNLMNEIGGLPQSRLPVPGEAPPPRRAEPMPAPRSASTPSSGRIDVGEQRPLPVPGQRPGLGRENNPYGDLTDIIRRGKVRIPGGSKPTGAPGGGIELPQGGGALDRIIREVLGGILGFQSNSVIGWIIRLIVVRWGWGFIQSILRRLLLGR